VGTTGGAASRDCIDPDQSIQIGKLLSGSELRSFVVHCNMFCIPRKAGRRIMAHRLMSNPGRIVYHALA